MPRSKGKCRQKKAIADKRKTGTITCYRSGSPVQVKVEVGGSGKSVCTNARCPHSNTPIFQAFES